MLLTSFLSVLAMGASWSINKHVKAYCILFLLLETGMLGVFMALDFFLFYVFWEVMLLPMYFLIGVWGGPRREYAAIKFFLYTLLGSVLMLIAILMLYFNSDLRVLAKTDGFAPGEAGWNELHLEKSVTALVQAEESALPVHTFNILALAKMGQHTSLFDSPILLNKSLQWWAFVLLFIGFAIKVPIVPFHTWLPDAHVEAPTPISMILAGVLLKMGGYGIIRICYPICPDAGYDLAYVVTFIGVLSMLYGAFAALAQNDFKRLVAYSSVSHMGYVMLGIGVWSAVAGTNYNPEYWQLGMNGAMFQMIAHGISSAGMFFMVGVIYDRVHHRNLNEFGGLFAKIAGLQRHCFRHLLRRLGAARVVRVHRRSVRHAQRLELLARLGRDLGGDGDSDRRLHSVDAAAGLPGARVQRSARRRYHADQRPRVGHCGARCWPSPSCSASILGWCSIT